MPKRSSKSKRPRDISQLAADIVKEATQGKPKPKPEPEPDTRDPAAVELGRKGGLKGGKARATKLTPEKRSEIAKLAAAARWKKSKN